jgi:hypothetical protein
MPSPICRHPRTSDPAIPRCFRCRQDDINSQTSSQPRFSNDTTQRGSQDTNHGQVEFDETVVMVLRALSPGYPNVPAPDGAIDEEGSQHQLPRHCSKHRRGFCDFWLPAFAITAPLPPISLWLLFILLRHRLSESQAALPELVSVHRLPNCAFTLLRYPSTRILFVSGLASSFAPYLGASFMTLWVFRVGHRLLQHAEARELAELPDPNQYGHMLCLLCALPLKLVTYMWSARRTDVRIPIVLRRAALILTLTCLFSGTIIVNDIVLGYTTRARLLDRVRLPEVPGNSSFQVSEECLSLNRTQNVGMPCSRNYITWAKDPEAFTAQQSEIMNIAHDQSERVTIRVVPDTSDAAPGVVLTIPKTKNLPLNRDFQASTIGARTTCRLRTNECKYSLTGPNDNYWIFNCTSAFRGVFGKKPPTSFEPDDPDTPPLIYKPTSQLM